jgi:hypothetical protein
MLSAVKYRGLLAFALLSVRTASGAVFYQDAGDLPQNVDYDFIIAGGKIYQHDNVSLIELERLISL